MVEQPGLCRICFETPGDRLIQTEFVCFLLLPKNLTFRIYLIFTAADVVLFDGLKMASHISLGNRPFRTILVISFPLFDNFVPRAFCTHFGHFVPACSSTGYEMTFDSQFVHKSLCKYLGHLVPRSFHPR